jgi:adenosine deaminase CECR1
MLLLIDFRFAFRADGQENLSHRELLLMFDQVVKEVKDEMKQQGREDEFIGARASDRYLAAAQF